MQYNVSIMQGHDQVAVIGVDADDETVAAEKAATLCADWEHVGGVWSADVAVTPPFQWVAYFAEPDGGEQSASICADNQQAAFEQAQTLAARHGLVFLALSCAGFAALP